MTVIALSATLGAYFPAKQLNTEKAVFKKSTVRLAIFLLICNPVTASAEKIIIPIGDSILEGVYQEMVTYPPLGYTIDNTGEALKYGGKRLHHWMAGRGTGLCDNEETLYGCLESAPAFDVILIFELGYNDFFWWNTAEVQRYENLEAYLNTWRSFYEILHTDFPYANILHITGYPMRVDNDSETKCFFDWHDYFPGAPEGSWFYTNAGPLEPTEPTCADLQECFNEANGNYHNFKNRLMEANADLYYVRYLDSWGNIAAHFSSAELEAWQDERLPGCMHLRAEYYAEFYNNWLRKYFEDMECMFHTDCDDAAFCNGAPTCVDGKCIPAIPVTCPEGQECNEGSQSCVAIPECAVDDDCGNGVFCDGTETCAAGLCVDSVEPCLEDEICNEASDQCSPGGEDEWDLNGDGDVDKEDASLLSLQQKTEKTDLAVRHKDEKAEMKTAIGSSGDCDEEWDLNGDCTVNKDDAKLLSLRQKDQKTDLKEKHTAEKAEMKAALQ